MTRRKTLIIFAKTPRPGRVKTRLAQDIGPVAAAWWYRHCLTALLRRVGRDPRWTTVLAVSPDPDISAASWPAGTVRTAQGTGDLGRRMARALAAAPPGPALLIGSDVPDISGATLARAFALLGRADAVLGPADDGGYWSIGLRHGGNRAPAGFLENVRWSGPHTLQDTIASLGPLKHALADRLADVDDVRDLRRLNRRSHRSEA